MANFENESKGFFGVGYTLKCFIRETSGVLKRLSVLSHLAFLIYDNGREQ